MCTATLSAILLDPELGAKAEEEARKLSNEAASEAKEFIAALNALVDRELEALAQAEQERRAHGERGVAVGTP